MISNLATGQTQNVLVIANAEAITALILGHGRRLLLNVEIKGAH
jgi:hypothetical protein